MIISVILTNQLSYYIPIVALLHNNIYIYIYIYIYIIWMQVLDMLDIGIADW